MVTSIQMNYGEKRNFPVQLSKEQGYSISVPSGFINPSFLI